MGKIQIAFLDDDKAQGHEIEAEDMALLFRIADKMTDNDLEKIRRMMERKTQGGKENAE